ncbi:FAD-dependent monooxygenase [Pseudonocardia kujensis]|uniref:FAD-dependent monooxygenase n=1 Tax=Pseudonocardia kujensis TaxID=1128675 RepID=UPI001E2AEE65|nr:FAD-dependent monooxygenase [Pseudonocardia kujensis]MCE0766474.1 FAD-dependent monooxygenase [Pseudonocardia kujensis]
MRIVVIGGGPGALYFAISAKLRDAGHDITVIERDPPGATYGWGVVYWDDLLDALYSNDAESARELRAASVLWQQQEVRLRGETAFYAGYGYSVERAALLEILGRRAADVGVRVRYQEEVHDLSGFRDADLVVAADGAGSRVRQQGEHFGTTLSTGANPYIWLGTDKVFSKFLFDFRETPAGWVWCHAYPSTSGISTFIVECQERTWNGLGLDGPAGDASTSALEEIFSDVLGGRRLISESRGRPARWLRFTEVVNDRWHHDGVVLLGDAAHTTHFTIGSGTRLAILDAIALAQSLYERGDSLPRALDLYEKRRRRPMMRTQAAARSSMAWFERVDLYTDRDSVAFAAAMAARQGSLPPWRHQLHLLEQLAPARAAHRCYETGHRFFLARRRGEPLRSTSFAPRRAPAGTVPAARPRTEDLPAPQARSVAV